MCDINAEQLELHKGGQGTNLEDIVKQIETMEERFEQEGYLVMHESIVLDGLKGTFEYHMLFSQEIEDAQGN